MRRNYVVFAVIACLSLLFVLTACKSDEEKLVGMFEELGEIADSNKDDCDKMGDELSAWFDDNGDEFKELAEKLDDQDKDDVDEELKDRVEKAMKKLMGGVMACMENEKVAGALEKMDM